MPKKKQKKKKDGKDFEGRETNGKKAIASNKKGKERKEQLARQKKRTDETRCFGMKGEKEKRQRRKG